MVQKENVHEMKREKQKAKNSEDRALETDKDSNRGKNSNT